MQGKESITSQRLQFLIVGWVTERDLPRRWHDGWILWLVDIDGGKGGFGRWTGCYVVEGVKASYSAVALLRDFVSLTLFNGVKMIVTLLVKREFVIH